MLLTISYQERHHYITSDYTYDTLERISERDKTKRDLAREKGITLITIPCWWDGKIER